MSGEVPGWFKAGKKVFFKGKEEELKDYFHTSSPIHNSDYFNVRFKSGKSCQTNEDFYKENHDFRPLKNLVIEAKYIDGRIKELKKKIKKSEDTFGAIANTGEYKSELSLLKELRAKCTPIGEHIDKTWEAGFKHGREKIPDRLIHPCPIKNFVTLCEFKDKNGY